MTSNARNPKGDEQDAPCKETQITQAIHKNMSEPAGQTVTHPRFTCCREQICMTSIARNPQGEAQGRAE